MSKRPVYIPSDKKDIFVESVDIEFTWFPGFAKTQKQKSITSLHESIRETLGINEILEISSKSENRLGVLSSAFNLELSIANISSTVESLFQGSKVFERGGPFVDIYNKSSLDAKRDPRTKSSGKLKYFIFDEKKWDLQEDFYSWLYINGLLQNEEVKEKITKFNAFTDIEFNPKKSLNCQAKSAAIFTSVTRRKVDIDSLNDGDNFKQKIVKKSFSNEQLTFF